MHGVGLAGGGVVYADENVRSMSRMQSKLSEAVPVGSEETLHASLCSCLLVRGFLSFMSSLFLRERASVAQARQLQCSLVTRATAL